MLQHTWCNGTNQERSGPRDRPTSPPLKVDQAIGDEMVAAKSIPVRQGVIARETANSKLDQRIVLPQVSLNPFVKANNYVYDLGIQDRYLRPQSSHDPDADRAT